MMIKASRVIEQSPFLETLGSTYPWIVFPHCEDHGSRQTFCSMSQPFKSYGKSTSKFRINRVLGHSYGWLIISSKTIEKPTIHREFIFLWNPVSSESINLPQLDLKPDQKIYTGSLLSPPGNPGCVVSVFERVVKYFIFCKLGDKKWTKIPAKETDTEMQIIDDEPSNCNRFLWCSPVNYKGKWYALMSGNLKVIDQVKPKHIMFRSLECKLPISFSYSNCENCYLVESCGELCVIEITWGGVNFSQALNIEIFRLDSITMEWSQLKSSKDRAFFFSTNASYAISCPANESGIEGGFICFTSGTDRILYSFNIEDKSISTSLPCKNLQEPWSSSFRFMPDLSTANPKTEVNQIISKEVKQGEEEEEEIEIEERKGKQILEFSPDKSEAQVRNLCDLPLDIIASIAENLHLVDYVNFRLVCKTFRLVAPQIQWRETFNLESHSLPPWLMFSGHQGDSRSLHTFIDPKLGDRYLMNIPKSIIDFDIRYSKEGWLLMSSKVEGDSMFFYNPFIKKLISVPPQADFEIYHSFGFSSLPTSPGCIIVGISLCSISYLNFSEDEEWHDVWRGDYPHFIPGHNSPVYFDGSFYFLGQDGNLGVFSFDHLNDDDDDGDDDDAPAYWHVLEKPRKPCNSYDHNYLLECDGKLFSVFVDNLGKSVGVFELNDATMAWRKVRDLGNYMFFLSPLSSFSMVAKTPGMENKIYFPKIRGKQIVYYCLTTAKYRTFGSKQVAANFYNTTEYLFSCWIQQRWL